MSDVETYRYYDEAAEMAQRLLDELHGDGRCRAGRRLAAMLFAYRDAARRARDRVPFRLGADADALR